MTESTRSHVSKFLRISAAAVVAASLVGMAGCGSSSSASSDTTSGSNGATTTAANGGSTNGGNDKGGAAVDVCKKITPAEVSAIVGGAVKVEAVPGGGCRFSQDDVRAPTAAFDSTSFTGGAADFDSAKSGVTGTISGTPKDLSGVGDKAVVVVGTSMGGSNQQGGGLVAAGDGLAQVTVTQGNGLSAADVEAMTTKLLSLAASKL